MKMSISHLEEVGKRKLSEPELVQITNVAVRKIKARIRSTQSRQKSYTDLQCKALEFEVGDHVFLKVAPMREVLRFGKKGKLSPRFIGPFELLERIGPVAYRLALPPNLSVVHNIFHVAMLPKYIPYHLHVLAHDMLSLIEELTYKEDPVQILDKEVKRLRNYEIALVKVLWNNHKGEEATRKRKEDMRILYLTCFRTSTLRLPKFLKSPRIYC